VLVAAHRKVNQSLAPEYLATNHQGGEALAVERRGVRAAGPESFIMRKVLPVVASRPGGRADSARIGVHEPRGRHLTIE
jgi:hypothetical protein